jgi:S-adenosylmethionine:tRNA ribosyltransferase-isomerase
MSRDSGHTTDTMPAADGEHIPAPFRLSAYQYELPPELIAQEPAAERDRSRLLVVHRKSGITVCHRFSDLPGLVDASDCLVFNETKVTPASLTCRKPTGGAVELLVLDPAFRQSGEPADATERTCLVRSAKRLRSGATLHLEHGPDLVVVRIVAPGRAIIRFPVSEDDFLRFLDRHGAPPLPPYIRPLGRDRARDTARYQTVYARTPGSVAAPTAGLHFTSELLMELESRGVTLVRIALHVGPGTFTPVRVEDTRNHQMETESYEISEQAAERLSKALKDGRRIIAIGTTSARALESAVDSNGAVRSGRGTTELFIKPGYRFRAVEGMITNFHLPGSTLLMMVSALGGGEVIRNAYEQAVRERFRFYSYGDACLIID